MPKVSLSKALLLSVVSAGAALLFTPKSGKELRQDLKDEGVRMKDEGNQKVRELMDDVKSSIHEVDQEMGYKQDELARTISEIEKDLQEDSSPISNQEEMDQSSLDPTEAAVGDVKDTPYEPQTDETVPSDSLEEALEDNELDSKPL
ncbi:YtxH domain-containing protein [Lacticigenium naphthae]|uniref:YtxH domain-containing protein n=1 Tax=Lacticigenium naphthae TaxID=515351 RepID=UPI000426AC6C|nr:YtxH domain-containing protein [Lacticigenium naphthae]